ncbi:MAG: ORF6N domain-containing protein [Bacteroidales bacterium]|jgi:phage regulator Rha-like protein|nr:ORF6N domain-containing protein [Bacteroidales bacterium]
METLINFNDVNNKIMVIRNKSVILDSAVAELYGVETMHINQAVKNNPNKFPKGYIFQLNKDEWGNLKSNSLISKNEESLRSNFLILEKQGRGQHRKYAPKAFTEKGLYMLATILKSPQATQTTIAIVEVFAKLKQLSNNIATLNSMEAETIEPEILESTGGLLNELLFSGLPTSAETSFEVNLGVMKAKHIVKSEKTVHQSEFDELKKMIAKINERLGI